MRFVDIDVLELPANWQGRANEALNELRAEVEAADAQARTTGQDVVAARRKAITDGLKKSARQTIWGDLAANLAALSRGKCWYSESLNPTSDKNVDHFRPKNGVAEEPDHEGYWWKAFDWKNYRYASQWCNQRRVDKVNGTSGGKWDQFPLQPGSFRARTETDDADLEVPMLLDPTDPDDWKLLTFLPDGFPTPAKSPGTLEYERAAVSIDIYHLHCRELVIDRRLCASRVRRTVEDMEVLLPKLSDDPHIRKLYKERQKELMRLVHPNSPYSSAALSYAKAEVYKLDCGRQVKREWLEDVLNAGL